MHASSEQLESAFRRAVAVADHAVGLWLARNPRQPTPVDVQPDVRDQTGHDVLALRAMVRAAATAYARQLKAEGLTPERMLVLGKEATSYHVFPGFDSQELRNYIVRWSIEAYFDE